METQDLISIQRFCTHYNIPVSFINSLDEFELIEVVTVQEVQCISKNQIKDIEKMIRLHYELNINLEGIDAICNLLDQVESLQDKVNELSNRLNFYERK